MVLFDITLLVPVQGKDENELLEHYIRTRFMSRVKQVIRHPYYEDIKLVLSSSTAPVFKSSFMSQSEQ